MVLANPTYLQRACVSVDAEVLVCQLMERARVPVAGEGLCAS